MVPGLIFVWKCTNSLMILVMLAAALGRQGDYKSDVTNKKSGICFFFFRGGDIDDIDIGDVVCVFFGATC